jgi:hypothetical protein
MESRSPRTQRGRRVLSAVRAGTDLVASDNRCRPMPVTLSLNTIASARKPTAGREVPASRRDPSRFEMELRRSFPRRMM